MNKTKNKKQYGFLTGKTDNISFACTNHRYKNNKKSPDLFVAVNGEDPAWCVSLLKKVSSITNAFISPSLTTRGIMLTVHEQAGPNIEVWLGPASYHQIRADVKNVLLSKSETYPHTVQQIFPPARNPVTCLQVVVLKRRTDKHVPQYYYSIPTPKKKRRRRGRGELGGTTQVRTRTGGTGITLY